MPVVKYKFSKTAVSLVVSVSRTTRVVQKVYRNRVGINDTGSDASSRVIACPAEPIGNLSADGE